MAKALIVSDKAQENLRNIISSVVEYTTHAASGVKLATEIYEKYDLISMLPKCGKLRDDGTRELFARSYRIVYEETEDSVVILTVIHARKLYPPES